MKKLVAILLSFTMMFVLISTDTANVDASFMFTDDNVNTLCLMRSAYSTGASTSVDDDEHFGNPYLVKTEHVDEVSLVVEKNWIGSKTYDDFPKYEVLTFEYPILLDTLAAGIDENLGEYSFIDFNPEMILNGESYSDTYVINDSNTVSREIRTNYSVDYARSVGASLGIPVNGIEVGVSASNELRLHFEQEFRYNYTSTISINKTYNTSVSNTSGSAYYQNGEPIFVEYGTRGLYRLQVVVVNEIIYNQSSYITGSWFTKVTHYNYNDDWADYKTIYSGFEYYNAYNRYHFPFVYTFDTSVQRYELVDEMRYANRFYVN